MSLELIRVTLWGYNRGLSFQKIRVKKATVHGDVEVVVDMGGEEYTGTIDHENFIRLLTISRKAGHYPWMPYAEQEFMFDVIDETKREFEERERKGTK